MDTTLYDAYGLPIADTDVATGNTEAYQDPVGFGGQHGYYHDTETGLSLLTNRYYAPKTGRFITRDPIGYQGGINLYGFAGNDPVNEMDPSGDRSLPSLSTMEKAAEAAEKYAVHHETAAVRRFGRWSVFKPRIRPMMLLGTVGLSTTLFFMSQTRVADDSTGPGSPYYAQHHQFWKRKVHFAGKDVYQRDDQFQFTPSNIGLMKSGNAPYGVDGKPIVLHHMLQTDDGPLAEVTMTFHQRNFGVIHINMPTQRFPSGINRDTFDAWKAKYWMQRAQGH